jgi:thiol-disulfide isomerase/thioredoxin
MGVTETAPRILSRQVEHDQEFRALVGTRVPDALLRDEKGAEMAMKAFHGMPVIVTFWATWCEPCTRELPVVGMIDEATEKTKLVVIGVDWDLNLKTGTKWLRKNGYGWDNFAEAPEGPRMLTHGLPTTLLIDADGIIRYYAEGWTSEHSYALLKAVKALGPEYAMTLSDLHLPPD